MKKLGYSFTDNLSFTKKRRPRGGVKSDNSKKNSIDLKYLTLILLLILAGKTFYLQIIQGTENRNKSDQNRVQIKKIIAQRGVIYDNQGQILAFNKPRNYDQLIESLTKNEEPSVFSFREYPYGLNTAHILSGIEFSYDALLKGIDGRELIETDALGKKIMVIKREEPIPGKNISLTLDINLQKTAVGAMDKVINNTRYFGGKVVKGAVIVTNYKGEVLVLYSAPSFDPTNIADYLTDTSNMPLVNRAISGTYPPGSTFKIVTALSALMENKINSNTRFEDTGVLVIGEWKFPNWLFIKRGQTDGFVDVVTAIKRSNDIFFYKTAEALGMEDLQKWMKKFGLGEKSKIDLPGEVTGLVPTSEWKMANINEDWYLGDTYHLGIGQGYVLVTPLQVNLWTLAVANGGKLCKPRLVQDNTQNNCKDLGIKAEYIDLVKAGMKGACETNGTGWPFFDYKKTEVYCKTGTAEFGDPQNKTHAWFTAFTKDIVVTVLVESGGEGSDVSSFVAKDIIDKYYE